MIEKCFKHDCYPNLEITPGEMKVYYRETNEDFNLYCPVCRIERMLRDSPDTKAIWNKNNAAKNNI